LAVAGAADADAVNVTVLDPDPGEASVACENAAVTPEGNPAAESVTADWNPEVPVTIMRT
jgi:hypothetical protein